MCLVHSNELEPFRTSSRLRISNWSQPLDYGQREHNNGWVNRTQAIYNSESDQISS